MKKEKKNKESFLNRKIDGKFTTIVILLILILLVNIFQIFITAFPCYWFFK